MRTNKQMHVALCAMLFLSVPVSAFERNDCRTGCIKNTLCEIERDLDKLLACGSSISISREDIGTTGYVIDRPGNYCLKEDVNFNPTVPGTNAIEITASNVNLTLAGHVLNQGNTTADTNGIYVSPDQSNVNVFNGTISNFYTYGVNYDQSNSLITLDGLTITNCGTATITDVSGLTVVVGAGIWLGPQTQVSDPTQAGLYVSQVRITNCNVIGCGVGCNIFGRQDIYTANNHFDESTTCVGLAVSGVALNSLIETDPAALSGYLNNFVMENSTCNNGVGTALFRYGGALFPIITVSSGLFYVNISNFRVVGNQFNNNTFVANANLQGGAIGGGIQGGLFENNQFNYNTGSTLNGPPLIFNGLHVSANQELLGLAPNGTFAVINNEMCGNQSGGSVQGMTIDFKQGVVIKNNRVNNNRSLAQLGSPIGVIPQCSGIDLVASTDVIGFGNTDARGIEINVVVEGNECCGNIAEQGSGSGITLLAPNFVYPFVLPNFTFRDNKCLGNAGLADSPAINFLGMGVIPGVAGIGTGIVIDRGYILDIDNIALAYPTAPGLQPIQAGQFTNLVIENNTMTGNVIGAAGAVPWIPTAGYAVGAVVAFNPANPNEPFNGNVYYSLQDNNVGNQPDISAAWVALIAPTGNSYSGGVVTIGVATAYPWSSAVTYGINAVASFGGTTYISLQDNNTNNEPDVSSTFWAVVSASSGPYSASVSTSIKNNTLDSNAFAGVNLTGGIPAWANPNGVPPAGVPPYFAIGNSSSTLSQNNTAVNNGEYGFFDANNESAGPTGNAFVANTGYNNPTNFETNPALSVNNVDLA